MTTVPVGRTVRQGGGTARVLVAAWLLAVAASVIGHPEHAAPANLITAFLLWRIWRGATWSRHLLVTLSCMSGGFAAGIGVAIVAGATGIVTSAPLMLVMYAGVGVLLTLPSVRGLARPTASRSS
jgi:ABC-type nitrate/sulfonate/bicarbonate transport system permease component